MTRPFACVVNLGCRVNRVDSARITSDPAGAGLSPVDLDEADDLADLLGRSRLGVKVQDGCNNRCSYCIVWKARGPERSVPVASVLEQVRRAERAGIPEVVLTGVNLGAYDGIDASDSPGIPEVVLTGVNLGAYDGIDASDSHVEIDELLDIILEQTNIPQVRLSSLEPMDVHDRLIDAMVAGGERVAPFLHLPLQSGCTATLERMNRPYTAEQYEAMVDRIRTKLPNAAISCDIIAGFPGETDEEFAESRALSRAPEPPFSGRAIRGHGRSHPHQAPERRHLLRHHRRLPRRDG